ncbi:tRNA lysidine(34) synthetase TilS, partial [Leucobacter sp. M11]|uniref:tRNA lysidine(34) synthetase TilS n=1 Tax=Leucobacter sp. M11 TaxID=2993565 RepID=UPI002D80273C
AREARYAALRQAAAEYGAHRILTGHTLDDQAETVLLGLARGSGTGSLAGMRPDTGLVLRPLLGLRRSVTLAACAEAGLDPWQDPHNADPMYRRVRVRERVLPVLERELGPGIAEALARTAEQSREDEESFADMIEEFIEEIVEPSEAGIAVLVSALEANPPALRQRIIRLIARAEFGVSLSRQHTLTIAKLVTGWTGQDEIHVPGIRVKRADGRLRFRAAGSAE